MYGGSSLYQYNEDDFLFQFTSNLKTALIHKHGKKEAVN